MPSRPFPTLQSVRRHVCLTDRDLDALVCGAYAYKRPDLAMALAYLHPALPEKASVLLDEAERMERQAQAGVEFGKMVCRLPNAIHHGRNRQRTATSTPLEFFQAAPKPARSAGTTGTAAPAPSSPQKTTVPAAKTKSGGPARPPAPAAVAKTSAPVKAVTTPRAPVALAAAGKAPAAPARATSTTPPAPTEERRRSLLGLSSVGRRTLDRERKAAPQPEPMGERPRTLMGLTPLGRAVLRRRGAK